VRPPALLAIDGGGSKVDAALVRRDGTVVGAARIATGTGIDGMPGEDDHMRSVVAAARAAARAAGHDPDAVPLAELGVYCLSGADLPVDDRRIGRWLRRHPLTAQDVVRNDSFAVLRAGTGRTWGIGVVCGYGTNCSGVAPDGRVTRFPAIGPVSGDFGGGIELGTLALWHAIRDEDGRGPSTALRTVVPTHFAMRRPSQVMQALYLGSLDTHRLTELTPLLFRTARRGDVVARDLVWRQADEIVSMATVAIGRLRLRAHDVDVVLGGGVFRNGWAAFLERIEAGIHAVAPEASVRVLQVPPLVGAAVIGLERLGAAGAAHRRLRARLTERRITAKTSRRTGPAAPRRPSDRPNSQPRNE
jgi:N-acetylglucosamine kinase-like BadF-type ATPase